MGDIVLKRTSTPKAMVTLAARFKVLSTMPDVVITNGAPIPYNVWSEPQIHKAAFTSRVKSLGLAVMTSNSELTGTLGSEPGQQGIVSQTSGDVVIPIGHSTSVRFEGGYIVRVEDAMLMNANNTVGEVVDSESSSDGGGWGGLFSYASDKIDDIGDAIEDFAGDLWDAATDDLMAAWDSVSGFAGDIWDSMEDMAKDIGNALGDLAERFNVAARAMAAMDIGFAMADIVSGLGTCLTGAGIPAGIFIIVKGLDDLIAGARNMLSGNSEAEAFRNQAIDWAFGKFSDGAFAVGAAAAVKLIADLISPTGAARAGKSIQKYGKEAAEFFSEHGKDILKHIGDFPIPKALRDILSGKNMDEVAEAAEELKDEGADLAEDALGGASDAAGDVANTTGDAVDSSEELAGATSDAADNAEDVTNVNKETEASPDDTGGNQGGGGEGDADSCSSCRGDPVNVVTGEFVDSRQILQIPGTLPLNWSRRYSSFSKSSGSFGKKWADSWGIHLVMSEHSVDFIREDKQCLTYRTPHAEINAFNRLQPRYRMMGKKSLPIYVLDMQTHLTYEFGHKVGDQIHLTKIFDANTNTISFEYSQTGLSRVAHSDGYALKVTSQNGRIHRVEGAEGEIAGKVFLDVEYRQDGMPTAFKTLQKGHMYYEYNARGVVTRWHDTDKTNVEYQLDGKDRVVATSTPQGYYNDRFEYHPEENYTIFYEGGEYASYFHYDHRNLVCREVRADGKELLTEWNPFGQKSGESLNPGLYARYEYNQFGSVTKTTLSDGRVFESKYDELNRLVERRHPNGRSEKFEYDAQNNLRSHTSALGLVTKFRYDAQGKILRQERASDESQIQYKYDQNNRLSEIVSLDGEVTKLKLDAFGRLKSVQNAEGGVTIYDYSEDAENPYGALRKLTDPNKAVHEFTYNSENLVQKRIDPLGQEVHYEFDAFDLLRKITRADGTTVQMQYDQSERLKSITNPNGDQHLFTYDRVGRLICETDFLGRKKRFAYNDQDRVERIQMPNGTIHKFTYGPYSLLKSEDIFAPITKSPASDDEFKQVESVEFSYDGELRLKSVKNETCHIEYEYDGMGLMAAEIINGKRVASKRDETTGQYLGYESASLALQTQYTRGGKLQSMAFNDREQRALAHIDFDYNQIGAETHRRTQSGFALRQNWNVAGALTSQRAGAVVTSSALEDLDTHAQRDYAYDALMRVTQIDDKIWGQSSYDYNSMGQISAAKYGKAAEIGDLSSEKFQYDRNNNLAKSYDLVNDGFDDALGLTRFASTAKDAKRGLAGRIERHGDTTYAYDEHGRLASKRVTPKGFRPETWRFEWNHRDQLVKASNDKGETWEYTYDLYGRRLSKTCASGKKAGYQENFLWQGDILIETVAVANGEEFSTQYVYKPGSMVPVAQVVGGEIQYIVTDHLGTPTELFSEKGELIWSRKGRVWGGDYGLRHLRAANDNGAYTDCLIRFQGQYFDAETGLHYNRYRYYDPDAADYLTPDPIGIRGGLRSFGYVHDPLGWIDTLGLNETCGTDPESEPNLDPEADLPKYEGELKFGNEDKIRDQMKKRGWTDDQLREAMATEPLEAMGKNGPASRYIHPETGRSVVVDNRTGEIFHVGGDGFLYD